MEFHDFASEYPMMPAYELSRMEEGMREHGFNPMFPIIRYQGKILDGRNRYLAAQAAGIKPAYKDFKGDEEAARWFVQFANEERRHLAADWLQRRRKERIDRVAAARAAGASQRAIAEQEGVSRAQVVEDLKAAGQVDTPCPPETAADTVSGVTPVTPETPPKPPAKVTGRDGKSYPATQPAKPPAPPKQEENGQAAQPKQETAPTTNGKPEGPTTEPEPAPAKAPPEVDAWGIPIQEHAKEAFAAVPLFDEILKLLRQADKLYSKLAEQPGGARLIMFGTSINSRERWKSKGITDAICALEDNRPKYTVCPLAYNPPHEHEPDNRQCPRCYGLGWTVAYGKSQANEELIAKVKAVFNV